MVIELLFWCSVALVLYAYVGYPLALIGLSTVRRCPVRRGPVSPSVSFIITAHNEQARIRAKIQNTLALSYPRQLLEIIVASDCSTDRTDEIVAEYAPHVRLIRAVERRGKEAAQQLAIAGASGEVLIFSDVATALAPDAVATIVRNFADPSVGCVSSVDRFIEADGRASGEGMYIRYETFLRRLETKVNSLVGLSGSFFAARRRVCRRWAPDRQSDFNTLLNAVESGLRGVLDEDSVGYYHDIVDERRERQRKVRTIVRGIGVLTANRHMLNPIRYGMFAWQLLSHKLCRWLVPAGMIVAAFSNAVLAIHSSFYSAVLLVQMGFYIAALAGWWWPRWRLLKVPSFLLVANLAVLTAWIRYARGDRMTVWTPSERISALPHTSVR
jgi:glycosyltransferase involved in cell wall biosynthesis